MTSRSEWKFGDVIVHAYRTRVESVGMFLTDRQPRDDFMYLCLSGGDPKISEMYRDGNIATWTVGRQNWKLVDAGQD
jgi:hypothetical protein